MINPVNRPPVSLPVQTDTVAFRQTLPRDMTSNGGPPEIKKPPDDYSLPPALGLWHSSAPWLDADGHPYNRFNRGSVDKGSFFDIQETVKTAVKTVAQRDFKQEVLRFGRSTTAHGVPMVLDSRNWFTRGLWTFLTVFSLVMLIYNCNLVYDKYNRKEKIVSVELKFEQPPFPAITICNLNAFKNHLVRKVPEISETLDAYHQAVTYSHNANEQLDNEVASGRSRRGTGGFRYVQYTPVMSDCNCAKSELTESGDCVQSDGVPKANSSLCICNFDRQDSTAWPCFHVSQWAEALCPECNDIGYCNLPETNGTNKLPCLCHKENYCLLRPSRLKRLWEIRGSDIPDESSPFRADFLSQLKELGYENMTDEVAITTKTKEKLVLTMAGLPVHRRIALSYGKHEFIRMCSFNGQQCNIINDFKLHVDPAFGNCYTFNANREKLLYSSRAGPSYGLRLMVYINSSDNLPTTESSGVRLAIHGQAEWPFPDTFGYSAPTGALSSFGLTMRKVKSIDAGPEGNCVNSDEPLPYNYIYRNYEYEPEGCYKSCYQDRIIKACGCADPRYPTPRNETPICDSLLESARECLIEESDKFIKDNRCRCKHRCTRMVYTTTYSSAKLASGAFRQTCKRKRSNAATCFEYDGTNAAMIEIYYEQMSYESLTEHQSYLFVNMISDFGGQAGLWLGASVLTLGEFIYFFFRLSTAYCRNRFLENHNNELDLSKPSSSADSDIVDHAAPRVMSIKRRASIGNRTNGPGPPGHGSRHS